MLTFTVSDANKKMMTGLSYRDSKPPVSSRDNILGLTPGEQMVMDKLIECYAAFLKLDREHPDEMRDFVDGIHRIQGVLAMRIVRRCYPEGWPTYKKSDY